jgi:hypothetical protein
MHMNVLLIIGLVIVAGIILLNSKLFEKKDKRKEYLEALAAFLESKVEPLEQGPDMPSWDNSYQIRFAYKGRPFIYQDIEDRLEKSCIYKAYLRASISSPLRLDFTERDRSAIRADVQTLSDIKTPWARDAERVTLPPALQELTIFTNDPVKSSALFADEIISRIFVGFKGTTSVGKPYLSLALGNGFVTLTFHPQGALQPTWADLQDNASRIEGYLEQLSLVAEAIDGLEKK